MANETFADIKNRIQASKLLSEQEKQEWTSLLPKMSDSQLNYLEEVLSLDIYGKLKPDKKQEKPVEKKPKTPRPQISKKPTTARPRLPKGLQGIKALALNDLKAEQSVYTFLGKLRTTMLDLVQSGTVRSREVISAFEASKLYKLYLQAGLALMSGDKPKGMSREEFEAITDFRADLKKSL